mmetsp:Transcript_40213/g.67201  ORF Transcript_40213/g.67201 Transcript_40213/m.67201 type:complete len:198 (-) Transcript_40213:1891-2484(-)
MNAGQPNSPGNGNPACQVFVGGISWKADEAALSNFFSSWGKVTSVRLIMDRETGKSKGYGFVTFQNQGDAEKVKILGNIEFMGKMMNVSNAVRRANRDGPGGFSGPAGSSSSGYQQYGFQGASAYQAQPQAPMGYYQNPPAADPAAQGNYYQQYGYPQQQQQGYAAYSNGPMYQTPGNSYQSQPLPVPAPQMPRPSY